MKELIARLTGVFGPSGYEDRIRAAILEEIKDYVDEHRVDPLGNLIAVKRARVQGPEGGDAGKGNDTPAAPLKVMLAAHMDEIGVMVTYVDEKGFCRFTGIGGIFPEFSLGARVVFANGVVGTFGSEGKPFPESGLKREAMFLDVGAGSKEDCPVKVGDPAAFQHSFVDLGQRLLAHNFDDRIGCATLVQVLRELDSSPHDIYAVFTVQEEVGTRGATTSSYGISPDLGIALDVTATGDTPEAHPMNVALGGGPAIKVMDRGTVIQPAVKQLLIEAAEAAGVRYQFEVLEFGATDARSIQVAREGVPVGVVSIPSRYVHTTSQMVDCGDVTGSVTLLKTLLSRPIRF